jgi:hypothetical protein
MAHRGVDSAAQYKPQMRYYMATFWMAMGPPCQDFCRFGNIAKREARTNVRPAFDYQTFRMASSNTVVDGSSSLGWSIFLHHCAAVKVFCTLLGSPGVRHGLRLDVSAYE